MKSFSQTNNSPAKKAVIMILATGGTIAGMAISPVASSYDSGKLDIHSMIDAVPEIKELAAVHSEQLANVGSQDFSFDLMIKLAGRINDLFQSKTVDGVVVTHGTDTMEETAFFLNLTVKSRQPVVMTGAMRPYNALSADGPLNLYQAVVVAADPDAVVRGVLVVMNDRIHGAHSLSKTNTSAVETFLSPIRGLIGTVDRNKASYFRRPYRNHTFKSELWIDRASPLPRVDIIYACADMPADMIACSAANGAKGIVFAGHGNGNLNAAAIDAAAELVSQGIVIVRSSKVPTGTIVRNVEIDDDRLGFIVSDELNPVKARILLMLALHKQKTRDEIQTLFYSY